MVLNRFRGIPTTWVGDGGLSPSFLDHLLVGGKLDFETTYWSRVPRPFGLVRNSITGFWNRVLDSNGKPVD